MFFDQIQHWSKLLIAKKKKHCLATKNKKGLMVFNWNHLSNHQHFGKKNMRNYNLTNFYCKCLSLIGIAQINSHFNILNRQLAEIHELTNTVNNFADFFQQTNAWLLFVKFLNVWFKKLTNLWSIGPGESDVGARGISLRCRLLVAGCSLRLGQCVQIRVVLALVNHDVVHVLPVSRLMQRFIL